VKKISKTNSPYLLVVALKTTCKWKRGGRSTIQGNISKEQQQTSREQPWGVEKQGGAKGTFKKKTGTTIGE
jgi:hypothetical protein